MKRFIKHLCELGPLVLFFYLFKTQNLEAAILPFILASFFGLLICFILERRVSMMMLTSTVLLAVFGGLTVYLDNKIFFYMKPTLLNTLFSVVLAIGLWFKKYLLKQMLNSVIEMEDEGWKRLTQRFIVFFFLMAVLNEIIWRTQSESFWVMFKVFGFTPISFIFMISQYTLFKIYSKNFNS